MAEGLLQVVEDVLQNHGKRLCDIDLASRKAQEASLRRYEAAGWLRKIVGVVAGKDLPAQPSEEEFRLGLRSGIILCNALNKIQPGAVPKVVEAPCDAGIVPDGAARSAYQYFENVRNFLDAMEEKGIPTFEASDFEQGGKSSRIVNCVLALRSYNDWKQGGGSGVWKFGGNSKPPSTTGKQFVRRNCELFMNSLSRSSSAGEKSLDSLPSEDLDETGASQSPLQALVRELISDKKLEDIPVIVENMLSKVMEQYEQQLESLNEQVRTTSRDTEVPSSNNLLSRDTEVPSSHDLLSRDTEIPSSNNHEEIEISNVMKDEKRSENDSNDEVSKANALKHQELVEHLLELKSNLHSTKEDMQMLKTKYEEEVNKLGEHMTGLAHAASGYQKVVEENRKLYNQVQDLKGNIRVYCRTRPFMPGQSNGMSVIEAVDDRTLSVLTPSKNGKAKKLFTFNKVFGPSASQEEVFLDTQPLIRSVLDGYNVCIFAYGQTGSGKTFTMTGPKELTPETLGVNYRALSDLFLISEQRKNSMSYVVSVQMMEIYNEQVRDLLVTDGVNKKLEIRNNSQNGFNVPNANLVPVTSTEDVINLMNLGHKNRAVSSTAMNDRSSRSHSCLTVHVQGRDLTSGSVLRGCMHLVDLAGSERADKSEVVGDRMKEAQHINRSLSALGDVMSSLAQKQSHVPYRNSKLTQLLQDSLGGQAKTLMFVHISPESDALGETISTLKFAERVSTIELGAARSSKDTTDVKELKEQIASLKAALARKDRGSSRSSSPDRAMFTSSGSSPSCSSWQSTLEGRSNSSSTLCSMEEVKSISGDWVDKIMLNNLDNGLDDSYEVEVETSDTSEIDYQCQFNINPKPKEMGSKTRKPSPKQTRSLIPQPPTRRTPNGINASSHKNGRQTVNAKRKPVGGGK